MVAAVHPGLAPRPSKPVARQSPGSGAWSDRLATCDTQSFLLPCLNSPGYRGSSLDDLPNLGCIRQLVFIRQAGEVLTDLQTAISLTFPITRLLTGIGLGSPVGPAQCRRPRSVLTVNSISGLCCLHPQVVDAFLLRLGFALARPGNPESSFGRLSRLRLVVR